MKTIVENTVDFFRSNPPQMVSVIRLEGPIGPSGRMNKNLNLDGLEKTIQQAFAPSKLSAVALAINSPGGSPVQSALIMDRIRDMARKKDVPILAFIEDVGASGGYLLALAGDEIFAHECSIVGSIGVIFAGFGFPALLKKHGVERRVYTAGEKKMMLDPFSPEKEDDVEEIKVLQGDIHEFFIKTVKERRGKRLKGKKDALFTGEVWTGEGAAKNGLVDGVGDMNRILRERFGQDVRLRTVGSKKTGLAGLLASFTGGGDTAVSAAMDELETRVQWSRWGL